MSARTVIVERHIRSGVPATPIVRIVADFGFIADGPEIEVAYIHDWNDGRPRMSNIWRCPHWLGARVLEQLLEALSVVMRAVEWELFEDRPAECCLYSARVGNEETAITVRALAADGEVVIEIRADEANRCDIELLRIPWLRAMEFSAALQATIVLAVTIWEDMKKSFGG